MNAVKEMKTFAAKVKMTANLATLIFIASMTYTVSQWHSAMYIDNLSNILVMVLIMVINLRFYQVYQNIMSLNKGADKIFNEGIYKREKRMYQRLLRISLWMGLVLIIASLLVK